MLAAVSLTVLYAGFPAIPVIAQGALTKMPENHKNVTPKRTHEAFNTHVSTRIDEEDGACKRDVLYLTSSATVTVHAPSADGAREFTYHVSVLALCWTGVAIIHLIMFGPLDCFIDLCFMPLAVTFVGLNLFRWIDQHIGCVPWWGLPLFCVWAHCVKEYLKWKWKKSKKSKKIEAEETPAWV